jgi:hypothetical protein
VLEGAVKAADEWDDEVAGSLLRWELCYAILLVGEGRDVSIFKVLSIAKEVHVIGCLLPACVAVSILPCCHLFPMVCGLLPM